MACCVSGKDLHPAIGLIRSENFEIHGRNRRAIPDSYSRTLSRVEQEAHVRVVDDQERGSGTPSSMTYNINNN